MVKARLWHSLFACLLLVAGPTVGGEPNDLDTKLMLATVKVTAPGPTGTGFVLGRGPREGSGKPQHILVTTNHGLVAVNGDEVTLVFHRRTDDGDYSKCPVQVRIREGGKALWTKHPGLDVAVLRVSPPSEAVLPILETDLLATDEDIEQRGIHPGYALHCVGFPHASQFEAGNAGFGLIRTGCIASFPLLPTKKTKTFFVDLNTFEGDSGAPVYCVDGPELKTNPGSSIPGGLILGVMVGQQLIDEEFKTIYEAGKFRHRLGLGIVIHASAVRETIEAMERAEGEPK